MATGYTHILLDKPETTFEEFALRCARAFGATIEMRDDPLDVPPPAEVKPDDYYLRQIPDAEARVRELEVMTAEEAEIKAAEAHREALKFWRECNENYARKRRLYEAMLAKVEAWEPPSPGHEGLKKFMREQIVDSIKFDCHESSDPPEPQTGEEWLADRRAYAMRTLQSRREGWEKEQQAAREATAWLKALHASLRREAGR